VLKRVHASSREPNMCWQNESTPRRWSRPRMRAPNRHRQGRPDADQTADEKCDDLHAVKSQPHRAAASGRTKPRGPAASRRTTKVPAMPSSTTCRRRQAPRGPA
jgi:hypothetical protein